MRLFFSYGHDENEPIVQMLRQDLIAQGFEVWIDRYEIKGGDDWRRKIAEDILGCDMTVAFASEHSVRCPGVCLDELTIAVSTRGSLIQSVLLEKVDPPAAITRRQYFDFSDWKAEKAKGESSFQAWYAKKWGQLIDFLSSEPVSQFVKEMDELEAALRPDLTCLRRNLLLRQEYIERPWMDQAVRDWLKQKDSPLMLIEGGPGSGKSIFIANTYLNYAVSPAVVFCDWAVQNHNTPEAVFRSLLFQLASSQDDYRAILLDLIRKKQKDRPEDPALYFESTEQMVRELLVNPLDRMIDGNRPDTLIIIDGLDEAALDEQGQNPLIELLQKNLFAFPKWLRFLITSRPVSQLHSAFPSACKLSLSGENARTDTERLIHRLLARTPYAPRSEQLADQCEDNMLLAERICKGLITQTISVDEMDQAKSVADLYSLYFSRVLSSNRPSREQLAYLSVLAVSPEPIPRCTFARLDHLSLQIHQLTSRDILDTFGSYIVQENGCLRLFHKSLADWLLSDQNELYGVTSKTGWTFMADLLYESYRESVDSMNAFELQFLVPSIQSAQSEKQNEVLMDKRLAKRLLVEAKKARDQGDLHRAYSLEKSALAIYSQRKSDKKILRLCEDLCDLAYHLVLTEDAASFCKIGRKAAKEIDSAEALQRCGSMILQAAYSVFRRSLYKKADKLYVSAISLFEETKDTDHLAEAWRARGENVRYLNSDLSLDYLAKALELARSSDTLSDPSLLMHILETYGRALLTEKQDLPHAEIVLNEMKELLDACSSQLDPELVHNCLYSLALLHYRQGSYALALEELERSISCLDPGSVNLCDALNLRGNVWLKMGQPQKAVQSFRESYSIRLKHYGSRYLLTCSSYQNLIKAGLASISSKNRALDDEEVIAYKTMYAELLTILHAMEGDQARFRENLARLDYSNFLTSIHEEDEALVLLEELLKCFEDTQNWYYVVIVYKNRALLPGRTIQEVQEDIEQALDLIETRCKGSHSLKQTLLDLSSTYTKMPE